MTDEQETTTRDAEGLLRKDYWDDVRGVVENLQECIKDGEVEDTEAATEWLHETVDGHERVIYTHQAMQCLLWSDNDGAYADDFGSEGMVEDGCIMWSRLAYAAFLADIYEHIGDLDELFESDENGEDA